MVTAVTAASGQHGARRTVFGGELLHRRDPRRADDLGDECARRVPAERRRGDAGGGGASGGCPLTSAAGPGRSRCRPVAAEQAPSHATLRDGGPCVGPRRTTDAPGGQAEHNITTGSQLHETPVDRRVASLPPCRSPAERRPGRRRGAGGRGPARGEPPQRRRRAWADPVGAQRRDGRMPHGGTDSGRRWADCPSLPRPADGREPDAGEAAAAGRSS